MEEDRGIEDSLLVEIVKRLDQLSAAQHRQARDHRILTRAATQLRLGRRAEVVVAEIKEQNPALLRDYCDIHVTLASTSLRLVGRRAASA
jgi:hypothetical protein